jgi:hypothetical protein
MKPVLCKAGQQLREQFDDTYDRDRRSDGWIGDLRHSARPSDHNPDWANAQDGIAYVRAIDVDRDVYKGGKPDLMPDIADQIRRAAKRGEKRISYIIFDGRIASPRMGWRWRKYRGSNPHRSHCHISFTKQGDKNGSFFNIPLLGGTV